MKAIARSLVVIMVALIAVPALVVSVTITSAIQLLATTALIMGGTQHSLGPDDDQAYVHNYLDWAVNGFVDPGGNNMIPASTDYNAYAVIYPAQFAPVTGTTTFDDSVSDGVANLGSCLGLGGSCDYNEGQSSGVPLAPSTTGTAPYIVYGYSQSAVVASLVKNQLIEDEPTGLDQTEFYLISNPMRPNGGVLGRGFEGFTIPLIGITFYGPTENSCPATGCTAEDDFVTPTVDVAQQYDFLGGDAPARPLNVLAMTNSIMAYALLHGNVQNHELDEPGMIDQGTYGDTHYYLIPSDTVPILLPLVNAGVPAAALAIPNEILKVWINDAYVRDKSPGEHVTFQWSPIGNPISLIGNTLGAVPVGIDDTVAGFTTPGNRPLGTQPSGPYGVGGPDPDQTPTLAAAARTGSPEPTVVQDQQTTTPGGNKLTVVPDSDALGNDAGTSKPTTPDAIKPSLPFEKWRESLNFKPGDRPSVLRPNGEGPLKRIVNALTGQKPKTAETETSNDAPESAKPAA
jgi:hypothetical protein